MVSRSRSRLYSSVLYMSPSQLDTILARIPSLIHYAYILHDKEDCEPHIHCLTYYSFQRDRSSVIRDFRYGYSGTVLTEIGTSRSSLFLYLTHDDKPDKYQYPVSDIVSNDLDFWSSTPSNPLDNTLCILEDINRHVRFRTLVQRYGRDFVIHYSSYFTAAQLLKKDDDICKDLLKPLCSDLKSPFDD